jgi:hypothetical protein
LVAPGYRIRAEYAPSVISSPSIRLGDLDKRWMLHHALDYLAVREQTANMLLASPIIASAERGSGRRGGDFQSALRADDHAKSAQRGDFPDSVIRNRQCLAIDIGV